MSWEEYKTMARLNRELGLRSSYHAAMAACSDMLRCERDFFIFSSDNSDDCSDETEYYSEY